ncbi:MAG: GWxTD domain-containing protein, partial [candidate division WOR-3 bacterium]
MILLLLLANGLLVTEGYRFDDGYMELWFQLPLASLVDTLQLRGLEDTVFGICSYVFDIRNVDGSDSAFQQVEKEIVVRKGEESNYFIDYIPLSLYPGRFAYILNINARDAPMQVGGIVDIPPVMESLTGSDVVIGRWGFDDVVFHGMDFMPAVGAEFLENEILFSYIELYGLVPDSLTYHVTYRISGDDGRALLERGRDVLKYDYVQVDTHSVILVPLTDGRYEYALTVSDPSSQGSVTRKSWFSVKTREDPAGGEFYDEIKYVASDEEYGRYKRMNEDQRKIFLKEFWSRQSYVQFEKRMNYADAKFSVGALLGRDSERGRLYIKLGLPDEIETMSVEY